MRLLVSVGPLGRSRKTHTVSFPPLGRSAFAHSPRCLGVEVPALRLARRVLERKGKNGAAALLDGGFALYLTAQRRGELVECRACGEGIWSESVCQSGASVVVWLSSKWGKDAPFFRVMVGLMLSRCSNFSSGAAIDQRRFFGNAMDGDGEEM